MINLNEVRHHFASFWADRVQEEFEWTLGSARERLPELRVRRVAPRESDQPWLYATVGASEVEGTPDRLEFVLSAPKETARHVETLTMLSYFHADSAHALRLGSVVDIGHPWVEGSRARHLLVSLPFPFGPRLEHCKTSAGDVRVLWLVPILPEEAAFARVHGVEALEDLLEERASDVVDPQRPSVVAS